jgi:hypothetical protein
MAPRDRPRALLGRRSECETLDRLLRSVRSGQSRVLVLRGEAGVGKTALLGYVVEQAWGWRIVRAAGVQFEMELAFAGLHQLCGSMLDGLGGLPGPQRDALREAFGLEDGGAPDRFLVALAVLSLLAETAEARPLVCVIDDVQWLDRASRQALAFVARRLLAEPIAMVFAVREPGDANELAGLPELFVDGLGDRDARKVLASGISGPLDTRVRDRIVAETRGNPLALLELPRGLTPAELAGGFGLPDRGPLSGRIERSFLRRFESLPRDSRWLLVTAAAEPIGDVTLLWRALDRIGIAPEAVGPAEATGLIELGARVRFRHPLVRSAIYRAAAAPARHAHRPGARGTPAGRLGGRRPVLVQPIAADDVARAVCQVCVGSPVNGIVEVAGPERFRLDELIRRGLSARNDRRDVIADPHARYFGAELSERTLVPGDDARLGETRLEDWLSQPAVA